MNTKPIFKTTEGKQKLTQHYDQLLTEWPITHELLTLDTRHGQTFIIASGDKTAPPLILLHGSTTNSLMWMGDVTRYASNYRVYAIDIPGEPGKSEPIRSLLNTNNYIEWLEDIYDALNIDSASIVGISLGAFIGLKFSSIHNQLVKKLVLLSPSGLAPVKLSFFFRILPLMMLGEKGGDKINKIVNGNTEVPESYMTFSSLIFKHFNARVESVPVLPDAALKKLNMPIYLLAGEKDALLHSKKSVNRLNQLVPHSNVELLTGIGHVIIDKVEDIMHFLVTE